jgi:hypothetical protein
MISWHPSAKAGAPASLETHRSASAFNTRTREYAEGDPFALWDAVQICGVGELTLPAWCLEAIEHLFAAVYFEAGRLAGRRSKRHWTNKAARDEDRLRWDLVKTCAFRELLSPVRSLRHQGRRVCGCWRLSWVLGERRAR